MDEERDICLLETLSAQDRKEYPIYSGVLGYFPDALAAVAHVSFIGNEQHHPGQPLNWEMDKSKDHLNCLVRHLMQAGTKDDDGLDHDAKVAWRALAHLQVKLMKEKGFRKPPNGR